MGNPKELTSGNVGHSTAFMVLSMVSGNLKRRGLACHFIAAGKYLGLINKSCSMNAEFFEAAESIYE